MRASRRVFTVEEISRFISSTTRPFVFGARTYQAGEVLMAVDPKEFMRFSHNFDSMWECEECHSAYADADQADECCQEDES